MTDISINVFASRVVKRGSGNTVKGRAVVVRTAQGYILVLVAVVRPKPPVSGRKNEGLRGF